MTRQYTMRGVQRTADVAVNAARRSLLQRAPGSRLHDVQADPRFQHRGVDLLWELPTGELRGVEVKGDRHARRGNYFFELVSNFEKDTPGCFLYSQAEWMLYVFLGTDQVHHLPLLSVREWFLGRAKEFELRHTHTATGNLRYTTVGALVPTGRVLREVPGAQVVNADAA